MRTGSIAAAIMVAFMLALAGCGSGNQGALSTAITSTLPTVTRTAPERTTSGESSPEVVTETTPPATVTHVATVAVTSATTATAATTTTAEVSPAAAAAAGAAVAASNEVTTESQTDWGWVAFGILAGLVLLGAIVWWWHRRHHGKPPDAGAGQPVGTRS